MITSLQHYVLPKKAGATFLVSYNDLPLYQSKQSGWWVWFKAFPVNLLVLLPIQKHFKDRLYSSTYFLTGYTKCISDQPAENPPPPSEWYATFLILKTCFFVSFNSVYVQFRLEESLINLYLSGYKQVGNNADVSTMSLEVDGGDGLTYLADGLSLFSLQKLCTLCLKVS